MRPHVTHLWWISAGRGRGRGRSPGRIVMSPQPAPAPPPPRLSPCHRHKEQILHFLVHFDGWKPALAAAGACHQHRQTTGPFTPHTARTLITSFWNSLDFNSSGVDLSYCYNHVAWRVQLETECVDWRLQFSLDLDCIDERVWWWPAVVVWEIERGRGCEILIQTLNEYSFIGFIVFLVIYDVLMGPVLSSSALFCSSQYASFLQVLTSDKPMYLI